MIDDMTIGEMKQLVRMLERRSESVPFEVGKAYSIRTCTYHLTGKVREIVGKFLVLDTVAWIADLSLKVPVSK